MKRWIAILLAMCLVWALAGCHKEAEETVPTQPSTEPVTEPIAPKTQVGLCLPEKTAQWETCAGQLQSRLETLDYETRVSYGGGSAQEQAKQVQALLGEGAELLVVASVDAHTLEQELSAAANAGVPVVTLDRQLLHGEGISATVTFDYVSLGITMGYQIAEAKQLATAREEKRSYTIEFLMGAADDQNAVLLHQGIMAVLQPYLDSGVLISKTGRVTLEDTYVQRWDEEEARNKFSQYLTVYGDTQPQIVCSASDTLAAGCIAALTEAGCTAENWPVITGIGGDKDAVRNILDGKQAYTVYRDTGMLDDRCARIVHSLLTDAPLPEQDSSAVTGTDQAPSYVCPGVQVDGIKGIGKLLDYGVSEKELALTQGDLEKINAALEETQPPETQPPETTAPTQPETTAPTQPETTAPAPTEQK